jgi:hypothetical protein
VLDRKTLKNLQRSCGSGGSAAEEDAFTKCAYRLRVLGDLSISTADWKLHTAVTPKNSAQTTKQRQLLSWYWSFVDGLTVERQKFCCFGFVATIHLRARAS